MGDHSQNLRRAAVHHRRLADGDFFQNLAPRFSPTAIFTTWDTNTIPQPSSPDPATPVTSATTSPTPTTPTQPTTPTPATQTSPSQQPPSTSTTSTSTPTSNTPPPVQSTTTTTTPLASLSPVTATTVQVTTPTSLVGSSSQANSAASSTSSAQPSSATNVGAIVGGIAGGLAALVLLVFVIRFIMRRKARKDEATGDIFSPSDFRRSAILMNDPPTHEDTVARGYNPRPPSMIERRIASSPAPTFGTQYGAPGPHPYGNNAPGQVYATPDPYGQYSSFGPGQVMNNSPPHPATPMYQNASYAQSPFSPISSPVSSVGPYEQGYGAPALTRQPSAGMPLTRQGSGGQDYQSYNTASGPAHQVSYPAPAVVASRLSGGPRPSSEYVDLDRTSVTPFQAAQYAEISKKLNTEVTPAEYAQNYERHNIVAVLAKDEPSPFADPIPSSLRPARGSLTVQYADRPVSADSRSSVSVAHEFDFPEPPSPALTVASRFRVDSTPPTLPEINVQSRGSVHSVHSSLGSELPSGVKGPGMRSVPAPSPLATTFPLSAENIALPATPTTPTASVAAGSAVSAKELKRPETLYDPEDAYGGI